MKLAVLTLGLALLAAPALAGEAFDACAGLAASKYEPGYEDAGPLDLAGLDAYSAAEAVDACAAALRDDPGSVQVKAWLGVA